ncbi:Transferase [Macleaya cordata]|uniref:Transferase n=1 Tax=Macleaya cordata TaxID=56857 RepID=A0A200PME0_MACCD|nr:Transferase [Macleaya cordata]
METSTKVEVISKETIKPSSPTPHHLRNFKLSLLDQLSPPLYVPIILFYAPTADHIHDHHRRYHHVDMLKRSLSNTLTRFYPLAGRFKDNILIDCNDEGVDYFEAKVNCKISDFMMRPDVLLHQQLLPSNIASNYGNLARKEEEEALAAVQINVFNCGGVAISLCVSHKIADASTITTFINGWAATSLGDTKILCRPTFDSASLFPPRQVTPPPGPCKVVNKLVVTKRFVFDAAKIAVLRARLVVLLADNSSTVTRVEAVSTLIWKSAMEVSRVKSSGSLSSKPAAAPISVVNHIVNLRRRMNPPLPQESFGNLLGVATAAASTTVSSLNELVAQLRVAINKFNNDDYTRRLKSTGGDDDEDQELTQRMEEQAGEVEVEVAAVEVCWMTSWCKFGLYEIDFGWGMLD